MEYYNSEFDDRKYWTYGCNCHVLGDRPMSDPGFGPPVDRLDSVCKQYKDCNKCAREKFGDTCIGEIVQYRYGPNVSPFSSKNTGLIPGPFTSANCFCIFYGKSLKIEFRTKAS